MNEVGLWPRPVLLRFCNAQRGALLILHSFHLREQFQLTAGQYAGFDMHFAYLNGPAPLPVLVKLHIEPLYSFPEVS